MVVVVDAGEGVGVGVPQGFGSGVVQLGWALVPVGVPRLVGGRAGGPTGLSWPSWPGGCRQRVIPPISVGVTGRGCASDAPL